MRTFEGGATRDEDKDKLDFEGVLSPLAIRRYAEYMHKHRVQADGKLRDSDNWQRGTGIPLSAYMKSKFRHFMDTWTLWRAPKHDFVAMEESLCAELFNTMGLLHELIKERQTLMPSWRQETKI
jgi:hypothetical protein